MKNGILSVEELEKISAFIERSECGKCWGWPMKAVPSGHIEKIKLECSICGETVMMGMEEIFRQVPPEKFADEREI